MRFALTKPYHDFFNENKFIELEGLLSPAQVETLNSAIDQELASRLKIAKADIEGCSFGKTFTSGHDLWRHSTEIKKIACRMPLAEIAHQLTEEKPLRLAFDQVFCTGVKRSRHLHGLAPFAHLMGEEGLSLSQMSGFHGIVCGLILCLSKATEKEENTVFPTQVGNGTFIHPEAPIPLQQLLTVPNHRFLLIAYCKKETMYTLNEADPHTHDLKRLGYAFGDKLRESTHPIVYK